MQTTHINTTTMCTSSPTRECPDIVSRIGKRMVCIPEPETQDKIYVGKLKDIQLSYVGKLKDIQLSSVNNADYEEKFICADCCGSGCSSCNYGPPLYVICKWRYKKNEGWTFGKPFKNPIYD